LLQPDNRQIDGLSLAKKSSFLQFAVLAFWLYTVCMKTQELSHISDDGKSIHVYRWSPDGTQGGKIRASVLLAHGMAEHAVRYTRFAKALCDKGYELWAPDHRGHGKTAAEGELGWLAPADGFKRVVNDLYSLSKRIKEEAPGLPLFLFGHSWGSFLSQGYMSLYGQGINGCILSGTAGNGGATLKLGRLVAGIGCAIKGQHSPAPLMDTMSFGSFNNAFKPNRTKFDWLSRDEAEVDAYIKDPLCGFICSYGFFRDLLSGLSWIHDKETMSFIPKDLPIFMIAGSKDPVGAATSSFDRLYDQYRMEGIKDLNKKLYSDGRHEVLNDTCREEATTDIIAWLDARI